MSTNINYRCFHILDVISQCLIRVTFYGHPPSPFAQSVALLLNNHYILIYSRLRYGDYHLFITLSL